MNAIKSLFSLIFKVIACGVVVFLLFALAGYFFVEQKNDTAGTIVLCSAVGIIPLWFMRRLILRFIKLSIITVLGLVGFALALSGLLKIAPGIVDNVSEDGVAMGLGALAMIIVALVAVKALKGIGSLFSGGGGGGSYSAPVASAPAPSFSAPSMPSVRKAPKEVKAKKETWHYALDLENPGEDRNAGIICPSGTVKATSYSDAMEQVQYKHSGDLNKPRGFKSSMIVSAVSKSRVNHNSYKSNRVR